VAGKPTNGARRVLRPIMKAANINGVMIPVLSPNWTDSIEEVCLQLRLRMSAVSAARRYVAARGCSGDHDMHLSGDQLGPFPQVLGGGSQEGARRGRPEDLIAAHRSLAFGTLIYVNNGKKRTVGDHADHRSGPFFSARIIDVSQAAAHELGFSGLMQVSLIIVSIPKVEAASSGRRAACVPQPV
jgi:hypothetical protein